MTHKRLELIRQKVKVTVNWYTIEVIDTLMKESEYGPSLEMKLQFMNNRVKTLLKDTYLAYFLLINVQCYTLIKFMETIPIKIKHQIQF